MDAAWENLFQVSNKGEWVLHGWVILTSLVYTDLDRHRWKGLWLGLPGSFQCKERSWVTPVRRRCRGSCGGCGDTVCLSSRAVKEGKRPRCAGCDLKPAEHMEQLLTISHVSVGDQSRDFTPHLQPPLQNVPDTWDLLREHLPHGREQWGQTSSASGIALLWSQAQTCSGFPAPGKKHNFSTVHIYF